LSKIKFEKELKRLIKNRKRIPKEFWIDLEHYPKRVIWFINRQKPSIEANYDFNEERFGITNEGEIVWGFDSGCSCPSPWNDNDDCYTIEKTWKEFILSKDKKLKEKNWFDLNWEDESLDNMKDYLLLISQENKPEDVLNAKNAEIRRYLMKRVGFENIKKISNTMVIHKDGASELIQIGKEKYIKVKDSSTDREYLLYVDDSVKTCKEAIAWTFNLKEDEYNPIIET